MQHLRTTLAVGLSCAALGAGATAQEYRYAVIELPPISGTNSYPRAINERGDVVGDSLLASVRIRATMWTAEGTVVDLGTLGGSASLARDINDSRAVTGYSYRAGGGGFRYNAFLWRDGEMTDLGTLTGDTAEAYGLNNSDQVVGYATRVPGEGTPYSGFLWDSGQMVDLGSLELDGFSRAAAISDDGQVVGWSSIEGHPGLIHATLWDKDQIVDLGTIGPPLESISSAHDINALGYVVGYSMNANGKERAFLWIDGRMYDLGTFPGVGETYGYGINAQSDVVGSGLRGTDPQNWRGFIWQAGSGMRPLNSLIPPSQPAWRIQIAWDINDAGQIACQGYQRDSFGTTRGVLLTPVHPTMEMAAPLPGRAGTDNTITITNATPGARVTILYSRNGGGSRIPGCDLQQNALQLNNPTVIGSGVADQNGVVSITRTVPQVARGQTILFQAVVQGECAISQLVVHEFE